MPRAFVYENLGNPHLAALSGIRNENMALWESAADVTSPENSVSIAIFIIMFRKEERCSTTYVLFSENISVLNLVWVFLSYKQ